MTIVKTSAVPALALALAVLSAAPAGAALTVEGQAAASGAAASSAQPGNITLAACRLTFDQGKQAASPGSARQSRQRCLRKPKKPASC
jgi:hypothetical protein